MHFIHLFCDISWWSSLLEWLNKWDTWLFLKINTQWISSIADALFPIIRDTKTTIPLYVFLLIFVFSRFHWKSGLIWLGFVIAAVIISDQLSSTFLKNFFHRVRPCNEPSLQGTMRFLLSYRPQSGSFTSSHAVNNFAIETFFFCTLRPYFHKWAYLFLCWAAIICYGQIYVGVHYPGDVIGGSILGMLLGWGLSVFYKKKFALQPRQIRQK